jgi:predicted kinase
VSATTLIYPDPSLILLCGLPGIGKSTFARRALEGSGALHLDIDDFFKEHGFNGEAVDLMLKEARLGLERRQAVVIDSTALRGRIREIALGIAEYYELPAHLIVFDGDPEIAAARRATRTSQDDLPPDSAELYRDLWEETKALLHKGKIAGFTSIATLDPINQGGIERIKFLKE